MEPIYLDGWTLAQLKEHDAVKCPVCGWMSVLEGWSTVKGDDGEWEDSVFWICENAICWFETEDKFCLQP